MGRWMRLRDRWAAVLVCVAVLAANTPQMFLVQAQQLCVQQTQLDNGGAEGENKIIVRSDTIDAADKAYVSSRLEEYYVLAFEEEESAKAAIEKYQERDDAEAFKVDTLKLFDTGSSTYSYLSWGPESIGSNVYIQQLLAEKSLEQLPEVVVGVIDSGVEYTHPFLKERIKEAKYDYVENDGAPLDTNGHGTHVAGIIADMTLPNVKINVYRVADEKGDAEIDAVTAAILQAIADGVDVINFSLGAQVGAETQRYLNTALEQAVEAGIVIVAAAGNGDRSQIGVDVGNIWPACYEEALTVTAIDENRVRSQFANYGKVVDLCAPGEAIYSTYRNNSYCELRGTSMAAPFVAGAAALLLSADNALGRKEIAELLTANARDLGDSGFDIYYGYGEVDLSDIFSQLDEDKNIQELPEEESKQVQEPEEPEQVKESEKESQESQEPQEGKEEETDKNGTVQTERITLSAVKVKQALNTAGGIKITWTEAEKAQGYRIYRKIPGGTYQKIKTVTNVQTTSYTDKSAKNGTTYRYKVVAYNGTVMGKCSQTQKMRRLTTPVIRAISNSQSNKLTVTYSSNKKATGYQIQYSVSKDFSSKKTKKVTSNKIVQKVIPSLKNNKTYYVRVRCYKNVGGIVYYSAWSPIKKRNVREF